MVLVPWLGLLFCARISFAFQSQRAFNVFPQEVGVADNAQDAMVSRQNGLGNVLVSTMLLSSIASGPGFTTLTHPGFPGHGVRVKKVDDFCDPTVKYVI